MKYKKVYKPNHPYAMKGGYVYEHRLVMEQILGRYLEPEEEVHHKDENPLNNDPSNLALCTTKKIHSEEHAYTEEELIDMLIRYNDVYGRFPTQKECNTHYELPHSSTFVRHFGSWSKAKHMAQRRLDWINER